MRPFILLGLILILGIGQTVQAGNYSCLTVGNNTDLALLKLNTGKVRTFALPQFNNALGTYEDNYAGLVYSPDHLRAAFVRPDTPADGKLPLGTLVIAPVNNFGEFGSPVVVHDSLPMPYRLGVADIQSGGTNFLWSSDGNYLFYQDFRLR